MTSGMTSGALFMKAKLFMPEKRPKRASTKALAVPSMTAAEAAQTAIKRLRPTACMSMSSRNSSEYQRTDQPPQTVTSRESLNE